MTQCISINEDGGIKRDQPSFGNVCEETVFDSTEGGDPFSFTLGDGEFIKRWEVEKAQLQIKSDYGYGQQEILQKYQVELTLFLMQNQWISKKKRNRNGINVEQHIREMSSQEKTNEVKQFKELGTIAFKANNYSEAIRQYVKAVNYFEAETEFAHEQQLVCHLNLSLCYYYIVYMYFVMNKIQQLINANAQKESLDLKGYLRQTKQFLISQGLFSTQFIG